MLPLPSIPVGWRLALRAERKKPYFGKLEAFLDREYGTRDVYPPRRQVFRALQLTPLSAVRVVLLGQDPYPNPGQAHGLCFSVPTGVTPPASLRNIHRELHDDIGAGPPASGDLSAWARQGVLLLNTVLTVRSGQAGSHRRRGWERFTDAVVDAVASRTEPTVFLLWGRDAQRKAARVNAGRHTLLTAPHPSPLSAHRGFFGSRPFSRANEALKAAGRQEVDWSQVV